MKREEIAKTFYGCHVHNNIKDKETAIRYLNDLTNYLNNYTYQSNNDFLMRGRKKVLYNEAMDILNGKQKVDEPIYFVLGSLTEFMCSDNQIYATDVDKSKWKDGKIDGKDEIELKNKNDHYIEDGYISLEERNEIMNFIISFNRKFHSKK